MNPGEVYCTVFLKLVLFSNIIYIMFSLPVYIVTWYAGVMLPRCACYNCRRWCEGHQVNFALMHPKKFYLNPQKGDLGHLFQQYLHDHHQSSICLVGDWVLHSLSLVVDGSIPNSTGFNCHQDQYEFSVALRRISSQKWYSAPEIIPLYR